MSGGSLNYLFCKEPADLFGYIEELEEVERELLKQGYKDIALDVRRLLEYLITAENRIGVLADQLRDVFKAVEWNLSGDYGDKTLKDVLENYRKGETDAK
jgi:hypothetical protein